MSVTPPASSPRLRPARVDEGPLLSALALRSKAVWGYPADMIARFAAELTIDVAALDRCVVAELDERVVGFYGLMLVAEPADAVELDTLYVEPELIGRGIGPLLLDDARRHARHVLHCVTMVIQADPHAASFYQRAGAILVGERVSGSIPGRLLPLYHLRLE